MKTERLTKKMKEDFIIALKSGKYVQTKGKLKREENKFCCLGVFCEINNIKHNNRHCLNEDGYTLGYSPIEDILSRETTTKLYEKNDSYNQDSDYKNDYSNVLPLIEQLETID